ncbi:MAG: DUF2284 domain-containing protein [Thermodesulfobacteriota bacterium]
MSGDLNQLIEHALAAGAHRAVVIPAGAIVVDGSLADKCRAPQCPNYGLSKNCPPHVAGPLWFRKEIESFRHGVLFTVDAPAETLFSDRRPEAFARLQKTAADIERAAVQMGFDRAQAYAGGSCKEVFCHRHADCPPLSKNGECRYPQYARPSMSGFGIDVAKLFESAGWTMRMAQPSADAAGTLIADICGLILVD